VTTAEGPFRSPHLLRRSLPFAVVAVLALASLALPPGPKSVPEALIAAGLLLVTAIGFVLPWERLPTAVTVLVPVAYTSSVLMTVLATGSATSGIGTLVLAPLIWTVLYHKRWESAVIVVAIAAVQIVTSLTPKTEGDAVIIRRVLLWSLLGALLSVAAHDLRDRLQRQAAQREEALRQTMSLREAAESLAASVDPEEIIASACRCGAELVSPLGGPARRAQYFRIEGDDVRLASQHHEGTREVIETFRLREHPFLPEVVATKAVVSVRLDSTAAGPSVQALVERLGLTHAVYIPVLIEGELHGVLSMARQQGEITGELFEQCKSLGHLLELALANALAHKVLSEQATTDALTGLLNRRGFESFISERPGRRPFAVLALDVDNLKEVNDAQGHEAGDALLVRVAGAVRGTMRRGDVLARLGGDEFAAFLFEAGEKEGVRAAERMLAALTATAPDVAAGVSIGIATGDANAEAKGVQSAADAAMYRAKRAGGSGYQLASRDATAW
jgi:diguanylate cyclase (GGDEF)-like protein